MVFVFVHFTTTTLPPPPPRFLFLSFSLTSSSTHCLLRCRYAFLFFSISRNTCLPLLCKLPVFFLLLLRRFCFNSISCNKHNSVVPVCYFEIEILLLCDLSSFFFWLFYCSPVKLLKLLSLLSIIIATIVTKVTYRISLEAQLLV